MSLSPEAAHRRGLIPPTKIDDKVTPKVSVEEVQPSEVELPSEEFSDGVDISLAPPLG